ncbi:hypothetical protein Q4R52_16290, partial [Morganella morganii]
FCFDVLGTGQRCFLRFPLFFQRRILALFLGQFLLQHIKAELEQAKTALEQARRTGDLTKMSELQYGKIPELEKQL